MECERVRFILKDGVSVVKKPHKTLREKVAGFVIPTLELFLHKQVVFGVVPSQFYPSWANEINHASGQRPS